MRLELESFDLFLLYLEQAYFNDELEPRKRIKELILKEPGLVVDMYINYLYQLNSE